MIKPKSGTVIKLVGLSKTYGYSEASFMAINNMSLEIERGEFVAIMGPSGCGKTTLLNIIGLLDRASEGEYLLENKPVAQLSANRRAKVRSRQIGFIFQHFNLLPRMNVIENVALPLTYAGVSVTKRLQAASRMLNTLYLREREYYMPYQLSGGQLQRVAIARALVNKPSIILADEPTGNLDSKSSEIIMSELRRIHAQGNTIIMVTHNPDLTAYADRLIRMKDGKIASDTKFPPKEIDRSAKRPLNAKPQRKKK